MRNGDSRSDDASRTTRSGFKPPAAVRFKRVRRQRAAERGRLAVAEREFRLVYLVNLARPLVDHRRAGVAEMTLGGMPLE